MQPRRYRGDWLRLRPVGAQGDRRYTGICHQQRLHAAAGNNSCTDEHEKQYMYGTAFHVLKIGNCDENSVCGKTEKLLHQAEQHQQGKGQITHERCGPGIIFCHALPEEQAGKGKEGQQGRQLGHKQVCREEDHADTGQ